MNTHKTVAQNIKDALFVMLCFSSNRVYRADKRKDPGSQIIFTNFGPTLIIILNFELIFDKTFFSSSNEQYKKDNSMIITFGEEICYIA